MEEIAKFGSVFRLESENAIRQRGYGVGVEVFEDSGDILVASNLLSGVLHDYTDAAHREGADRLEGCPPASPFFIADFPSETVLVGYAVEVSLGLQRARRAVNQKHVALGNAGWEIERIDEHADSTFQITSLCAEGRDGKLLVVALNVCV